MIVLYYKQKMKRSGFIRIFMFKDGEDDMKIKGRRWEKILLITIIVLLAVYIAGANFLVNAALVPATMEKLDAFSRITEDSMEALVHTDDIGLTKCSGMGCNKRVG